MPPSSGPPGCPRLKVQAAVPSASKPVASRLRHALQLSWMAPSLLPTLPGAASCVHLTEHSTAEAQALCAPAAAAAEATAALQAARQEVGRLQQAVDSSRLLVTSADVSSNSDSAAEVASLRSALQQACSANSSLQSSADDQVLPSAITSRCAHSSMAHMVLFSCILTARHCLIELECHS